MTQSQCQMTPSHSINRTPQVPSSTPSSLSNSTIQLQGQCTQTARGKKKTDTEYKHKLSSLPPPSTTTPLHSTTDDLYSIAFHSSPAHCKPFRHNDLHPTWSQIIASHPLNTLLTPPPACLRGLTFDRPYASSLSPVYVIIATLSSAASTQGSSQERSQGA